MQVGNLLGKMGFGAMCVEPSLLNDLVLLVAQSEAHWPDDTVVCNNISSQLCIPNTVQTLAFSASSVGASFPCHVRVMSAGQLSADAQLTAGRARMEKPTRLSSEFTRF